MNKKHFAILLIGCAFLFHACALKSRYVFIDSISDTTTTKKISLRDLSKSYRGLQNQYIETQGHVFWGSEQATICLDNDNDDEDQYCFAFEIKPELLKSVAIDELSKSNGYSFIIKGKLDTTKHGHLGAYDASIIDVYYIRIR